MLGTGDFIEALIPLYIMAMIGFFAQRSNILGEQANQVITQLMLYITLPALILFSLNTSFSKSFMYDFFWLTVMSIFVLSFSIVIAAYVRRRALLPFERKSVYESLIIFGNQGYIGFVVSYILLGSQGVLYVTLFNIVYFFLIWTYGIYLFMKQAQKIEWRFLFLNPGTSSTFIGLCMLFSPFTWPAIVLDVFENVRKVTIPLSMMFIGSLLATLNFKEFTLFIKNKYLWYAASFKLIFFPLSLFIFLLFPVSYPALTIAILTAGMPSASTTSIYAEKYDADSIFSSFGVMLSTLLCIFTIPFFYFLLNWLHRILS